VFRRQKWKLDNARKFVHKASNRVLVAGASTGKSSRISSKPSLSGNNTILLSTLAIDSGVL
jgi:hypothetical protein